MSTPPKVDRTRRNLVVGTAAASGVAGIAAALPFADSMNPSERAKALGAPVEADISGIQPGQLLTFEWRGKPVWVLKRSNEMLATAKQAESQLTDPKSASNQQPAYAKNEVRAQKPDLFVAVGICSHLGCSPTYRPDKADFFCPCHGSKFDLAGRVYKGSPAPTNLVVPPHTFLSDTRILIGADKKEG